MKSFETPSMNPEIDIVRANIALEKKEAPKITLTTKERGKKKSIQHAQTVQLEVISEKKVDDAVEKLAIMKLIQSSEKAHLSNNAAK